ncbi:Bax inhibitor-1/YccA family protein [Pseudomonadota bacterium]
MNRVDFSVASQAGSTLATNKLIKNTYMLLSATLVFSAIMAAVSIVAQPPSIIAMVCLIGGMVLGIFVLPKAANSSAGLGVIFLITGLLGFALGPMLTQYLAMEKGPQIVGTAFGGTGIIFLSLSGYALTSKRDFSFMGGFLFAGMMVVMLAMVANWFLALPGLALALSAAVILLMSGFILFDTSRMINGGETNYIHATFGLYLSIFNIFIHLLSILGVMSDD